MNPLFMIGIAVASVGLLLEVLPKKEKPVTVAGERIGTSDSEPEPKPKQKVSDKKVPKKTPKKTAKKAPVSEPKIEPKSEIEIQE